MQPLGSPQGSHDAPAHLFGVQRRVQHAAALSLPVAPLLLFLLLLKRPDDGGSGGAKRRCRRAAVRQRERVREHHPAQGERGSASEASTHCRQPSACVCVRSKENSSPSSPRLAESVVRASGGGASVCVCKYASMCARPHVTQIHNIHTLRGAELGHMIQSADLNQAQQCLHT